MGDDTTIHVGPQYDVEVVGQVFSQSDGKALAYIRFDRITDAMHAGEAVVTDPEPVL